MKIINKVKEYKRILHLIREEYEYAKAERTIIQSRFNAQKRVWDSSLDDPQKEMLYNFITEYENLFQEYLSPFYKEIINPVLRKKEAGKVSIIKFIKDAISFSFKNSPRISLGRSKIGNLEDSTLEKMLERA